MIGHKHIPSREGGVEVVVEELAVRMAAQQHQVTCYNRSTPSLSLHTRMAERRGKYLGVRLRRVPTLPRQGLAALSSSFFACLCAAVGPYDVVHIHAEGPALFCWLPRLAGKRVVLTIHGLDWARAKWSGSLGAPCIRLGERCGARFAHEIIVLNRPAELYFRTKYHRAARCIPNGVSRAVFAAPQLICAQFGLKAGSYFLFLGRIVPEKGCHILCEAFRRVKTDKKLVFAGGCSGSQTVLKHLRAQAAGDERIVFTGFVEGRLREELYSNAYAFVLPSELEGMSLSLLEAMSYGNCVIASDIPENASIVSDCGLLFPRGSAPALAEVLAYTCAHPEEVQRLRRRAADRAAGYLSWDRVVEQTLAVYEGTLPAPEAGPLPSAR